jgi:hypothetical protein
VRQKSVSLVVMQKACSEFREVDASLWLRRIATRATRLSLVGAVLAGIVGCKDSPTMPNQVATVRGRANIVASNSISA